jgi:hypothetical protein
MNYKAYLTGYLSLSKYAQTTPMIDPDKFNNMAGGNKSSALTPPTTQPTSPIAPPQQPALGQAANPLNPSLANPLNPSLATPQQAAIPKIKNVANMDPANMDPAKKQLELPKLKQID